MKNPSVTIPITSYNQVEFIEASVLSALEQDYENLKVVVWDDSSSDGSQDLLQEISLKYPKRLEINLNSINLGGGMNRIRSLNLADGELISYLDGDDIFLPSKITTQVNAMIERQNYAFCYHDVQVFDSKTNKTLYNWKDRFGLGDGNVNDLIRYGNFCSSLSIMFRKKDLPKTNYYPEITLGQDWLFFVDILMESKGDFFFIDKILARHRIHENNRTLKWEEKLDSKLISLEIIEKKYPDYIFEVKQKRSEIYLNIVVRFVSRKNYKEALNAFILSLKNSFPLFWNMLRLPIRESIFFIRFRKLDSLMRSLLKRTDF